MLRSWLNMKRYRDKNAPSGVFSGSARCSFMTVEKDAEIWVMKSSDLGESWSTVQSLQ